MREAEKLVNAGVKELLVISQDTSAYGLDIKYQESRWRDRDWRTRFYDLSAALGELGVWVRMHYVYPYPHVDEVMPLMAEGKILPYLDIPFQHASASVLKAMRRPASQDKVLARIRKWREACPDLTLRSTFIVGFPGETEADFEELLAFLDEARIERAGCFKYEPVKGATANDLGLRWSPQRWRRSATSASWRSSRKVSLRLQRAKVGKRLQVIIDEMGTTVAKAAPRPMRRRSTAMSMSRHVGRSGRATSSA